MYYGYIFKNPSDMICCIHPHIESNKIVCVVQENNMQKEGKSSSCRVITFFKLEGIFFSIHCWRLLSEITLQDYSEFTLTTL